jgi:hypothetical protein
MSHDLNELLKKQKEELDKLKTATDIVQAGERFTQDKWRYRAETLRMVVMALITSALSVFTTFYLESKRSAETERKSQKEEFKLLVEKFHDANGDSIKNSVACRLANFSNTYDDPEIAIQIGDFQPVCMQKEKQDSVRKELAQALSNIKSSPANTERAQAQLGKYEQKQQELEQKKITASVEERKKLNNDIAQLNFTMDSVAKTANLETALKSTSQIEQSIKQIGEINKNITGTDSRKNTAWFKEGYFVLFSNYRILCQYLNKKDGIQVSVCNTATQADCKTTIITQAWIKYDEALLFTDGGNTYRISLDAIDHAGKNPFTLAAYITFEKLNR